jgi:hypothetical protein
LQPPTVILSDAELLQTATLAIEYTPATERMLGDASAT